MSRLQLFLDGSPLQDQEKLSQRGIKEGGLIFFAIAKEQGPPKPKKGLGLADMIKTFDQKKK